MEPAGAPSLIELQTRPLLSQTGHTLQIKAALSAYVKSKDAEAFAKALADPLRGTGRSAEVGKALEAYVKSKHQLLFRKILQVRLIICHTLRCFISVVHITFQWGPSRTVSVNI